LIGMLILLAANICVGLSALFLVKNLFAENEAADQALLWCIFFLAQVIAVGLILGLLNRFYLPQVIAFHSVILLIIFLFSKKRNILHFNKVDIAFIFDNKILLLACSVFLSFFCVKTSLNLINPPICADSLQYHLAFPAIWIKNGNLSSPFCFFAGVVKGTLELSSITYYPINAQLFFAWLMLPLKNAFLADVGEVPFYIIGILAVYSILRKYSINKNTALFTGLLWALIPNLFKQIKYGSQIDVICAVLFLLVLNSLLLLKKQFNLKNALIFGVSLGIFVGTKIINIIWASALVPIFLYYFLEKYKTVSPRKAFLILSAVIFSVFIFGSYIYLKNFIHTGNPLFPVQIKVLGNTFFRGVMDNRAYSKLILGKYTYGIFDILFKEGLGVQFITFILPGTIIPLVFYRSIKNKVRPAAEDVLFFTIPLLMLSFYYFFIRAESTRYIFPYLAMALIVSIIFLDKFNWGKRYITIFGFISIIASASELAHRNELIFSILLAMALFILLLLANNKILNFYNKTFNLKTLAIGLIFMAIALSFLNYKYDKEEFLRYPQTLSKNESWQRDIALGWIWLNENTGDGKRIAYIGRSEIYPLFGAKFKNDVVYVPVNKKSTLPYDLTDGLYRKEKNFQDWVDNIKKLKIDLLFIALPQVDNSESDNPNDFPVEDQWAATHPQLFRQVFKNSLVRIYGVLK